ncbi:PspA/IM30 family protein [Acidicapsa dinghuensis]|uniref:PspA/IM30 family protein n=1 Tax=Acidicapsa dinghuensis TaxID=2218256 RepID=A0ABW1EAY0_9BACT|nr:PspA/IM30 family protein [Acidicapsa dinghuensis]
MPLLERVSTLLRANINDLIEKAENPEKLLKQLVLDMENQLLQVKTQVAIAIADQHLLERKRQEHEQEIAEWKRKAELAVARRHDDLARAALERVISFERLTKGFAEQAEDQKLEADTLRQTLHKLEQKLSETKAQCEILIAEHRRARVLKRATDAHQHVGATQDSAIGRMKSKVRRESAENLAAGEVLLPATLEDRFRSLEEQEQVELLLTQLKERAALPASTPE